MSAMLPLMRVLEQGGKFVQCIKYGSTLRGIDAGPPRRPLQPLNKDDKRELDEVIRTMDTAIARHRGGQPVPSDQLFTARPEPMTDLLTRDDYAAIAGPRPAAHRPSSTASSAPGKRRDADTVNPPPARPICEIAACNAGRGFRRQQGARSVRAGPLVKDAPSERKDVLIRLVQADDPQPPRTGGDGKPRQRQTDPRLRVDRHSRTITRSSGTPKLIDKIYDQDAPAGDDAISMIVREPIGVVAAVLPWNFPLLMLAWKIGPALAAGCSVIVKPAEQTSLTALRVAELAQRPVCPVACCRCCRATGPSVGEPLGRTWMWTW
jgi:gamma-glutamyl-gamma-aminobutyraldehyde dehydrogenase